MPISANRKHEYFGIDLKPYTEPCSPISAKRHKNRSRHGSQKPEPAQVFRNRCPLNDTYLDFHVKVKGDAAEAFFCDGKKGYEFFCRLNTDGSPAMIYRHASGTFRENKNIFGETMQIVAYKNNNPGIVLEIGYEKLDIPSWQVYVPATEE